MKSTHHYRIPHLRLIPVILAAAVWFPLATVRAQTPALLNYQGRVAVDAVNFEGAGLFKFALVNDTGDTTFWSNDGTSAAGSEPTAAVSLTVAKGLYSVLLGDTALADMAGIDPTVFANPDVRLRVWFDDGTNGSQLLSPDQRLAPAAYLATGAVSGDAIAPGSIGGTQIAAGSLDFTHLAVPAAPVAGQVLGFDGTHFNWTSPGAADGIWTADGANAYYNGGNIGIGTSQPGALLELAGQQDALRITGFQPFLTFRDTSSSQKRGTVQSVNGSLDFFTESYLNGSNPFALLTLKDSGNVGIGSPQPTSKLEVVAQDALALIGGGPFLTLKDSDHGYARSRIQGVAGDVNLFTESYMNGSNPYAFIHLHSSTGKVGIGSSNPGSKLDVVGQDALSLVGYQPFLTLWDSGSGYARGRMQSLAGAIVFETESFVAGSNPNAYSRLDASGNFSVKSLTIRGGADLAEPFPMSRRGLPPGTVVCIDPEHPGKLRASAAAYDPKVAGIVSGAGGIEPGISMIQENALEPGENVALSGRVYVRANASGGKISPGDMLTTSEIPGEAMKAADRERAQGAILGKAMTPLDTADGTVLVLVTLQ